MNTNNILERQVFHAGRLLISDDETKPEAYIIQSGEVRSYTVNGDQKLELERFGEGDVIGEANLVSDYSHFINYEAVTSTTVVKVNRQDFERKMKKHDPLVMNILKNMVNRIKSHDKKWTDHVVQSQQNDIKATKIVDHLLQGMEEERRDKYRQIILPQFNIMIKALEDLKKEERLLKDAQKESHTSDEGAEAALENA